MAVPNSTARKLTTLIRPLGYTAAPEILTSPGYTLPLLALTDQHTREQSLAVRVNLATAAPRHWKEEHAYRISELIEYAHHAGRAARVIVCPALTKGTGVAMLDASEALAEAVARITDHKARTSDGNEQ